MQSSKTRSRGETCRRTPGLQTLSNSFLAWMLAMLVAGWQPTALLAAAADQTTGGEREADAGAVVVEVFYRAGSDLSTKALDLLAQMEKMQPYLRVKAYDVLKDQQALSRLWTLARRQGFERPSVPAFYAYGQIKFGFVNAETTRREIEELYTIHAFTREGCPYCRDAKAFLKRLQQRRPGIRVEIHDVVNDIGARNRLTELSRQFQMPATGLPCFYAAGRFMVGFRNAETTGRQLESLFLPSRSPQRGTSPGASLRGSHRRLAGGAGVPENIAVCILSGPARWFLTELRTGVTQEGVRQTAATAVSGADDVPPPPPRNSGPITDLNDEGERRQEARDSAAADEIDLPLLGPVRVRDWGLPGFTFLVGLIDGFNPCAMWVLVFLLSVLVNIRDRKKIIIIAGTFVLISGLAYFSFMAAWLNVFVFIGWARPTQIALGLLALTIGAINVKDFVAFGRGVSLSIPDSAKPGIYARVHNIVMARYLTAALIGAAALAVLVNVIELLCTAGLPALYTQILSMQNLPAWQNYLYLALYNVAYMFDDTIMLVLAVTTLSHRKLQQAEGRWLKLVSGLVILALGLAMIFKPDWLH